MPKHRSSTALIFASCLSLAAFTSSWQMPSIFSLVSPDQVYAQTAIPMPTAENSISLTAIPPRIGDLGEIKIKPGEKFQTTVRIMNSSDKDIEVESFVKDFIIDKDAKTPIQVRESVDDRWSLASWIAVGQSRQMLKAGKAGTVNVLIEVPKDARPGGHYAMVIHQPAGSAGAAKEPASTGVNQQVGSLIYVTVEGQINEEAFIRDFAFTPNIAEFGPMAFSYGIDNESDIHIRPNATMEIYNLFNQKIDTVVIETQNVFPGTQRAFSGIWGVNWGFGPYKAILNVSYGSQGKMVSAQATAWLIPLSIIIAVLILILATVTGAVAMKRRRGTPPKMGETNSTGADDSSTPSSTTSDPS